MSENTIFILTARFSMKEHGYLDVKAFNKRENALKLATEKKEEFLQQIPDCELDETFTMDCFSDEESESDLVFYGTCKESLNFVEIRITPNTLMDQ